MKRTDRLYALMQRLKDGQLHTAEAMAQDLGVSVRTIYRDMETLSASGVPVSGARGVGFTAEATVTLPPLNLSEAELEALHLGLIVVAQSGPEGVSEAAMSLSEKIEAVLPEETGPAAERFGFAVQHLSDAAGGFRYMPAVRAAVRARQKLRVQVKGSETHRVLRPLKLDYWGRVWTCVAWDETSDQFLSLRMDQIETLQVLPGLFVEEPGKRLVDYQTA